MSLGLTTQEKEQLRTMLKDRSIIIEAFNTIRKNHENSIKFLHELASNPRMPQTLRSELFSSEMTMTSSFKIMEFIEMLFLNTSFLYERLDEITSIILKMNNESGDIHKKVLELQESLKSDTKSNKKGLNLLKHFSYDLSSFDVNAGVFKGHFEKKKS